MFKEDQNFMKSNNYFTYINIYLKRISFFYENKERIGSCFWLFLTMIFIFASLVLLIYQIIRTIQNSDAKAYDTTVYAKEILSIDIDINK